MRKRKRGRRPELPKLDLHGTRHADVEVKVEDFVLDLQCELVIVTGHSMEMKRMVTEVLDRHGFDYVVGVPGNDGIVLVYG